MTLSVFGPSFTPFASGSIGTSEAEFTTEIFNARLAALYVQSSGVIPPTGVLVIETAGQTLPKQTLLTLTPVVDGWYYPRQDVFYAPSGSLLAGAGSELFPLGDAIHFKLTQADPDNRIYLSGLLES